uniref:tRNA (guanine(10)-N(2))-methyltransferase TRMT11 N-terminal domain-containing protein n=1 Tax=Populus alba TaxID=43335 RepID=A0A4U5N8X1_POPAL|nr:hypothetical protein D5086_0000272240 [Populus alba]
MKAKRRKQILENHHPDSPFYLINLPSEDIARKIVNRSILVKGIFGKEISFQEQNDRIKGLAYLLSRFIVICQGRVHLKNPDRNFWLMETDDHGAHIGLPPVVQRRIFFCRQVGGAERKLLPTYPLKSLKYLGPATLDAEMAFLMANQAQGADIDLGQYLMVVVLTYGLLPLPIALLRGDNSLPRHSGLKEDASLVAENCSRELCPYTVPDDKRTDHVPSTAPYSLAECVHDLHDLAARMLAMGGRLVCFYPVLRDDDAGNHFPEHPCLKLIVSSEQIPSSRSSQVLLTIVKKVSYTDKIAEAAKIKHQEFKENHVKCETIVKI